MKNVLWRAKDVLNQKGWYQGGFESSDGKVCSLGAINWVFTNGEKSDDYMITPSIDGDYQAWQDKRSEVYDEYIEIIAVLLRTANELYPRNTLSPSTFWDDWSGIADFNDDPHITREMVMHVFNHAAAELDVEEESDEELPLGS